MRKIYLLLCVILLQISAIAQTDINIGSGGTTGNSGTTYPSPLQDFYEGSRAQFLYLASELTAAGMAPGNISEIKFNVTSLNNFTGTIEQLSINIGATTTASLTSNSWEAGATAVYGPVDYTPVVGINILTFTTPFFWNGADNIVLEICNGDPNNGATGVTTYTENVSVPWTTGLAFNGSHTYREDNLANLCGTATTTNSGTQTTRPDITFSWAPSSTTGCYLPSGTAFSNVTSNSATVSWNPPSVGSAATGYSWELRTSGAAGSGSTGLVTSGNTTTATTVNLTSLSPVTTYYFYIKTDCGSGNVSIWSGAYNFITLCAPISNFSQNFNAVTAPNLPQCWSKILRGPTLSTAATITTVAANAYSTPNSVSMYNSGSTSSDDIILVSPALSNLSSGTYQLSFFARNSILGQDVEVGTLDDNTATATFTPIETVTLTTGYQKYSVSFANYSGTDTYIGIRRLNANTFSYVYLDDINWELIPSCVEPSAILISNIATSTVQLDWTAPATGSPSSYEIYSSTVSTAPTGSTTPTVTGVTNTTYNLTGLTPATKYFTWIRSNCGAGGVSMWAKADSFYTQCNATNIPYIQDFESATVPSLPNCTALENLGTGNLWTVANNPGNGFTSKTLRYAYNTNNAADVWFFTQGLNLTGGTAYRITFRYGCNSATYTESMKVSFGSSPNASSMSDLIVDFPTIKNTAPLTSVTDFTPTSTGVYFIGFHAYSIANQFNLYVDDISIDLVPTCDVPTALLISNVTSAAAQLDWTAPAIGSPSSYDIYYSTANTAPNSTTVPSASASATTYNISGLQPSTKYFVWLRSNCGAGGISNWTSRDSFTTACIPVNAFFENFASALPPALPTCWSKILRGATLSTFATVNVTTTNAYSAPNAVTLYNSNSTSTDDIMLVSPAISNLSAGTYQLSFVARNSVLGQDLEIGTLDGNTATANFTPLQTVTLSTTFQKYTVSFSSYSGTDLYIGIRRASTTTYSYVYIDDIAWELVPTCIEPSDIVASNITANSAQIDWTAPASGSPSSYDLYHSNINTPPQSTTTPTIANISGTTANLTSLNSATTYYVWVRSDCSAGGKSVWSVVDTFSTLCDIVTTPTAVIDTFNVINKCWSNAKGILSDPNTTFTSTTASNWVIDDFGNVTTPINRSARLNIWNTNTSDWLISPMYNLGTGGNMKLEFDIAYTTYNGTAASTMGPDDKFAVVISTDNGVTWALANALRVWDATTPISNTGEHIVIDLASYTGVVMFAFYGESTVTNADNNIYVDNVQITQLLPVTLTSFKGERLGAKNMLMWSTATEQNNKGFELQRSFNGTEFSTIGFVKSKAVNGNSNAQINYSFADEKPFNGTNYYRLKQIDTDGKFALSKVVMIKGNTTNNVMVSALYPNPANSLVNIAVVSPLTQGITIVITDIAGKIVMQQSKSLIVGDNNINLPVSSLHSGTYFVKLLCKNGCTTPVQKFVKE